MDDSKQQKQINLTAEVQKYVEGNASGPSRPGSSSTVGSKRSEIRAGSPPPSATIGASRSAASRLGSSSHSSCRLESTDTTAAWEAPVRLVFQDDTETNSKRQTNVTVHNKHTTLSNTTHKRYSTHMTN